MKEINVKSHNLTLKNVRPGVKPFHNKSNDSEITRSSNNTSNLDSETSSVQSEMSSKRREGSITGEEVNTEKVKRESNKTLSAEIVSDQIPYFNPPQDFTLQKFQESNYVSDLFCESNLEGKQLWYIKAPSTLDISCLKSIPTADILRGATMIRNNGNEYEFSKESTRAQNFKIITPLAKEDGYRVVPRPINQVLHLHQVLNDNYIPESKTLMTSVSKKYENRVNKAQPKGLKMRFYPLGYFAGKPQRIGDDSSSETSSNDVTESEDIASESAPSSSSKRNQNTKEYPLSFEKNSSKRKPAILPQSMIGKSPKSKLNSQAVVADSQSRPQKRKKKLPTSHKTLSPRTEN